MFKCRISCGLELGFDADLKSSLEGACGEGYDFICVDISNSSKKTTFLSSGVGHHVGDSSNPTFMLKSQEWNNFVLGKLTPFQLISSGSNVEKATTAEAAKEELNFAAYLSLPAVLINIQHEDCVSYSRLVYSYLLQSHQSMMMWVCVPLSFDENSVQRKFVSTWQVWNKLRSLCNHHHRISVALKITAELPDIQYLKCWFYEPIKTVILPTSIFLFNDKCCPILSNAHQALLLEFFKLNCSIIITGTNRHNCSMRAYHQYIRHLHENQTSPNQKDVFAQVSDDYQRLPLQPLTDNLNSVIYEKFQEDYVKYARYQEAICQCLLDRILEEDANKTVGVIVILDAGRGPLIRAALQASKIANRKIKCYALEKNVNASITLQRLKRTEWHDDDVVIVPCDIHVWNAPESADLLVSEFLGSFGDKQRFPEYFASAKRFLKADAVCIPFCYKTYLSPVSSPTFYYEVTKRSALKQNNQRGTVYEIPYVVFNSNYRELADAKSVFTFAYPSIKSNQEFSVSHWSNARHARLSFGISCDSILHGFVEYFEFTLYKDTSISIVPKSDTAGKLSWFPLFFPLMNPIPLKEACEVSIDIWRCCSSQQVWYEWAVTKPFVSSIHNPGGWSYALKLL